jgi:hypothetical protein
MQEPQLELWSAEPHPPPPVYPQLSLDQRNHLIHHLAQLMFKRIQAVPPKPSQLERKKHER